MRSATSSGFSTGERVVQFAVNPAYLQGFDGPTTITGIDFEKLDAGFVSLSPALYETFAIVHRTGAHLSPAAQLMIKLATERILQVAEPLR